MSTDGFVLAFGISSDHPCLPGHFPGHPLVPGVMLLEQVALALYQWRRLRLTQVIEAKFVAPLLPGEQAEVSLNESGERIRFQIARDGQCLAKGIVAGAAA
ncbi:hydroxymyristoyl-ACP dehydratase [Dyella sp.]|uniref:hydroxymyristoyl-ACP dehydratase n=1 Tax=Dyella sp. TaxID=1869338 RepID=UPI002ED4DE57